MFAFDSLLKRLEHTTEPKALRELAHELGNSGDPRAVPILVELLNNGDDVIRNAAAVGLRELRDDSALPYIMNQLKADHTKGNRGTLMYALETLDTKDVIADIVRIMCDDSWETAAMALRVIDSQKDSIAPRVRSEAIGILKRYLDREVYPEWKNEILSSAIELLEEH